MSRIPTLGILSTTSTSLLEFWEKIRFFGKLIFRKFAKGDGTTFSGGGGY